MSTIKKSSRLIISDATASTTLTTGALVVSGGIGVSGQVTATNLSGTLQTSSQPNITSIGTLSTLSVSGTTQLTAGIASTTTATGTLLVTGGIGVSGQVSATNLAGTLQTASQPNITSIGTLSSLSVSGATQLTAAIQSTTTDTGTLLVTGGIGVSGQVSATNLSGTLQTASQPNITSTGILSSLTVSGATSLTAGTASTTTDSGTLVVTGGIGVSGQVTATNLSGTIQTASQPNITSVGTLTTLTVSGITNLTNTTESTSTTTGSVILAGGLAVAKRLVVNSEILFPSAGNIGINTVDQSDNGVLSLFGGGAPLSFRGAFIQLYGQQHSTNAGQLILASPTFNGSIIMKTADNDRISISLSGQVSILSNIASTSASTGSLVVTGGAGISGNLYVTGTIYQNGVAVGTGGATYTAGTNIDITSNTISVVNNPTFSGAVSITNNTSATNTSTGALTVSGGIGIGRSVHVGTGIFAFQAPVTASPPTTSGAIFSVGGSTYTNSATASGGTHSFYTHGFIGAPTLAASNTNVTTTEAYSFYIPGPPSAGTNMTLTQRHGLGVSGNGTNVAGSYPIIITNSNSGAYTPTLLLENTAGNSGAGVGIDMVTYGGFRDYPSGSIRMIDMLNYNNDMSFHTRNANNVLTTNMEERMRITAGGTIRLFRNAISQVPLTTGNIIDVPAGTFTNRGTAASGTASDWFGTFLGITTLSATNTNVTTPIAATLNIEGAPVAGTNNTITTSRALRVASGISQFNGQVLLTNNVNSSSTSTGALVVTGGIGASGQITADHIRGISFVSGPRINASSDSYTYIPLAGSGLRMNSAGGTLTDTGTAASGTQATSWTVSIRPVTLAAANPNVTITTASTVYIEGPPILGTNISITNRYSLLVLDGSSIFQGNIASTTTSTGTLIVTGGIGVSGQVTATNLAGTLQTSAQPNITSIGTLSGLTVSSTNTISLTASLPTNSVQINNANTAGSAAFQLTNDNSSSFLGYGGSAHGNALYRNTLFFQSANGLIFRTNNEAVTALTIASDGTWTSQSLINFTNTVEATSTNSGSVTFAGGVAVAKRLFIGGDIVYPNTGKIVTNTVDEGDNGMIGISGGGDAQPTRGAFIQLFGQQHGTNPGQLILGSTTIQGSIILQSAGVNRMTVNLAGDVSVLNNTASNSTSTGALIVTGGVGVGGRVSASNMTTGGLTASGATTLTAGTASTTTNSGTLIVTGGIGVSGQVTANALSSTSLTASGAVTFTANTASTNTSTGTLIVTGGVGLGGSLNVGNAIIGYRTSVTATPPTTSGSAFSIGGNTYTNTIAASGTQTAYYHGFIGAPTLAASNTNVTTTEAYSCYIAGPPTAGTNMTITSRYGLGVIGGGANVAGSYPVIISNVNTGAYTPTLLLENTGGSSNAAVGIDMVTYGGFRDYPSGSIRMIDMLAYNSDMSFHTRNANDVVTVNMEERMRITAGGTLRLFRNAIAQVPLTTGNIIDVPAGTFTNRGTAASGTASNWFGTFLGVTTLAATNTGVTTPVAATLQIDGAPVAGTNNTITNAFALNVASGRVQLAGNIASTTTATGTLLVTGGIGVSGQVTATNLSGTLQTAAQPNITSVGTLTGLTVSTSSLISLTSSLGNNAVQLRNTTTAGSASFQLTNDNSSSFLGYGGSAHSNPLYRNTLFFQSFNGMIFRTNNEAVTALTIATDGSISTPSILTITNNTSATNTTNGALRVTGSITTTTNTYSPAFILNDGTANMYVWRHVSGFGTGTTIDNISSGATSVRLNVASSTATGNYTGQLQVYTLGLNGNANQERMVLEANSTKGMLYWLTAGAGVLRPLEIWGATTFNTDGTVSLSNTTDSTSTATGALRVAGGVAISRSLTIGGGNINMASAAPRIKMIDTSNEVWMAAVSGDGSGDWHVYDITSNRRIIGYYRSNNTVQLGNITGATDSIVSVPCTSDSTATNNGALVVAGGIGVAKQIVTGNRLYINHSGGGGAPHLFISPQSANTETSISFNAGLGATGNSWIVGPGTSGVGVNTFGFYLSASGYNRNIMQLSRDGALTINSSTQNVQYITLNNSAGGAGASVGMKMTPFTGRTGGDACAVLGVDDGAAGAQVSLFSATGSNSYVECLRASQRDFGTASGLSGFVFLNRAYWNQSPVLNSDARLKEDIKPISGSLALEFIDKINPVMYRYKRDTSMVHSGVIAQNVESALAETFENAPEHSLVNRPNSDNPESHYGVSYDEFIAYLLAAVKEQQIQINELKQQLQNVKQ